MTITDDEINEFIEHFGTKGMKWGRRVGKAAKSNSLKNVQRNSQAATGAIPFNKRSAKQKAGIAAASGATGYLAANIMLRHTGSLTIATIVGGLTGAQAGRMIGQILDQKGNKKVSELGR